MFISCLPYLLFLHLPSATGTASSGRLTILDAALFLDLDLHKLIISVNNYAVHYQTIYTSEKKKKSLDVFLNSSPLIPPCKLKTSGWTKKNWLAEYNVPVLPFSLRIQGWKGQWVLTPWDIFSWFSSKFKQIYEAIYGEVYISAKCVLIKRRLWSPGLSVVPRLC